MHQAGLTCGRKNSHMGHPTPERLAYISLMREIEDFLYAEADLLDEREFV